MTRGAGQLQFLVIGDPIDHSLSPVIQQAALDWNGISATYGRRRVGPGELDPIMAELRSGMLNGVNVTMPMKLEAAAATDILTPAAQRIGAVNTLIPRAGEIHGDSTDIEGIAWAWDEAGWGADEPALVLGSGGAAAAALVALEGRTLWISARRPAQAAALLDRTGVDATVIAWGEPVAAVVVNATPIGMAQNADRHAPAVVQAATGWFDMVYGHETEALRAAAARGIPACDGARMLVGQAAASFSAWTGVAAPHQVMLAALGRA